MADPALALRAVKTRRDNALQVETTARVTAERDALRGALEVEPERACDTTTRHTLSDMLTALGGDR